MMGGALPNCADKSVKLLPPRSALPRFKRDRLVALMLSTDSWTPVTEPRPRPRHLTGRGDELGAPVLLA
jgi:hypothetical protein